MNVAIVAQIRNGPLYRYRQGQGGLSIKAAAEAAGCEPRYWGTVERMDFSRYVPWRQVKRIAAFLNICVDDICPGEMRGLNLSLTRAAYGDLEPKALLAERTRERLLLPSPADAVEETERRELLRVNMETVLKTLTYREREIIKLRFGFGDDGFSYTLEECAKIFKVTRERVRQVEAKALRKLQSPTRAKLLEPAILLQKEA